MPTQFGSMQPDPNDPPDGYMGTYTVPPDPPPQSPPCPSRTFQVKVNVSTGKVDVQGGAPASGNTSGSSTSTNQQTTTPPNPPGGGPYASPPQNQSTPPAGQSPPQGQAGTGMSHNGQGQTTGTSVAICNANQQAGPTSNGGQSATTWSVSVTTCYGECCYTITVTGSTDAQGNKSAPQASAAGP